MTASRSTGPILLFDGVCNLCNTSVQWVIRRDAQSRVRFASLQSHFAQNLLSSVPADIGQLDSVILYDQGRFYVKSDAILRLFNILGGAYVVFQVGYLIPRGFRDAIYDLIARKRYRWFGKQDACMVPTAELKDRFLD